MRWTLALLVLAACPGHVPDKRPTPPVPPPPLPGNEVKAELPEIPAKIDITTSAPTDGNAPDKRSPIVDILKTENQREIGKPREQPEPAYYLAYQLVEQRVVSLEAEGGALIIDSDDTERNIDVDVRVGTASSTTRTNSATIPTASTRR